MLPADLEPSDESAVRRLRGVGEVSYPIVGVSWSRYSGAHDRLRRGDHRPRRTFSAREGGSQADQPFACRRLTVFSVRLACRSLRTRARTAFCRASGQRAQGPSVRSPQHRSAAASPETIGPYRVGTSSSRSSWWRWCLRSTPDVTLLDRPRATAADRQPGRSDSRRHRSRLRCNERARATSRSDRHQRDTAHTRPCRHRLRSHAMPQPPSPGSRADDRHVASSGRDHPGIDAAPAGQASSDTWRRAAIAEATSVVPLAFRTASRESGGGPPGIRRRTSAPATIVAPSDPSSMGVGPCRPRGRQHRRRERRMRRRPRTSVDDRQTARPGDPRGRSAGPPPLSSSPATSARNDPRGRTESAIRSGAAFRGRRAAPGRDVWLPVRMRWSSPLSADGAGRTSAAAADTRPAALERPLGGDDQLLRRCHTARRDLSPSPAR